MSKLITASLAGSIDWVRNCPPSWKTKAYADLENQLARNYSAETPLAMKRGLAFESAVYSRVYQNKPQKGSEHFQWFIDECKGGQFQRKAKCFIEIDSVEYCLYGKLDVYFPNVIKDIKTTGNYKGAENYLNSFQHKLYCYLEQIPKFEYLVAQFIDDSNTIIAHHKIEYEVQDMQALKENVIAEVRSIIFFLNEHKNLMELYNTKFNLF